jgi:hypothetical protein
MSSQRASGLQYIRKFPKLAKLILFYEKYPDKEKFISEEAAEEFFDFCRSSAELISKKECFMCKKAAAKTKDIEPSEFWHACICIASDAGVLDSIESDESGKRIWREKTESS